MNCKESHFVYFEVLRESKFRYLFLLKLIENPLMTNNSLRNIAFIVVHGELSVF